MIDPNARVTHHAAYLTSGACTFCEARTGVFVETTFPLYFDAQHGAMRELCLCSNCVTVMANRVKKVAKPARDDPSSFSPHAYQFPRRPATR